MTNRVQGMAFPFRIDKETGSIVLSSGKEKVRQNVGLILGTRHGERPMIRDFGTKVPSLVHDPNGTVLATAVREQIHSSLLRFENRILTTQVLVEQQEAELRVRLDYIYVDEASNDQIVVPLDNGR